MDEDIKNKIKEDMSRYESGKLQIYLDDAGWEDWMNDYTNSEEGEECTEKEIKEIEKIQKELWDEVHPNED